MTETGIVIVTHNSEPEIGECLDSVRRAAAQIVVVDNASVDGTRYQVTRRAVPLIANPTNLGFAAAVNQGVRALETPFVLLINPDARLESGVEALVECCRQPRVAGACGKLVGADGRPQSGFAIRSLPSAAALVCEVLLVNRLWPGNPVNWQYRCLGFDFSSPGDVEQPAGAFFMIRRDVWEELHGFDERFYPLWFEDVDFCWRARERGYHMSYTPLAVAKHTGGHSLSKISLENRQLYWYRSLLGFSAKHFRSSKFRMVSLAVVLGALPRMLLGVIAFQSLAPIAVFSKVMAMAGRAMVAPPG